MRSLHGIVCVLLLLVTVPAAAHPGSEVRGGRLLSRPAAVRWTGVDWVGAIAAGDAGLALGGALGFGLGAALAPPCSEDQDICLNGLAEGLVGGLLLAPPAMAGAVTLYGDSQGHHGSYWAALGGGYLGAAAATGVMALAAEGDEKWIGVVAIAILPSLGSTLGYYLSRETSTRHVSTAGALLDLGRDGVVHLGVPSVGFSHTNLETVVSVPVFGGAL